MRPQKSLCGLLVLRRAAQLARWGTLAVAHTHLALPALAACLMALLLSCKWLRNTRLAYALEALVELVLVQSACSAFHQLYPATAGTSAVRAIAALAAGNGVAALILSAKTSPLPFRWQLPAVAAVTTVLLAHTEHLCASGLLQHGWASMRMAGRIVLPLVVPAFIDIMPAEGIWALAAPAPPASEAGAAQCVAYQASSVLLAAAVLIWHLWRSEQRRCKAASSTAAAAAARVA